MKVYSFSFDESELDVVLHGLGELRQALERVGQLDTFMHREVIRIYEWLETKEATEVPPFDAIAALRGKK